MDINLKQLTFLQEHYKDSVKQLTKLSKKVLSWSNEYHYSVNMCGEKIGIELDTLVAFKCIKLQYAQEYKRYMDSYNNISKYVKIKDEMVDLVKEVKKHLKEMELKTNGLDSYQVIDYEIKEDYDDFPY